MSRMTRDIEEMVGVRSSGRTLRSALQLVHRTTWLERTFLALVVLAGFLIFWAIRLLAQHFIYSPVRWRRSRLQTAMRVLFTALWIYLVAVYGYALSLQLRSS